MWIGNIFINHVETGLTPARVVPLEHSNILLTSPGPLPDLSTRHTCAFSCRTFQHRAIEFAFQWRFECSLEMFGKMEQQQG